jgi:hypothetical protein
MIPVSTGTSASPSTRPNVAEAPTAPTIRRVSPPNAAAGSPPPTRYPSMEPRVESVNLASLMPQFRPAIKHSHPSFPAVCREEQVECLVQLHHRCACSCSQFVGGSSPSSRGEGLCCHRCVVAVLLPSAWISKNNCLLYCTHVEKYYCTIFTGNYRMYTLRKA